MESVIRDCSAAQVIPEVTKDLPEVTKDLPEVTKDLPEVTNSLNTINLLKQYSRALIINIKPESLPPSLNIIFDSGAVNGVLGIGAALYLTILEERNYFKVKKVSGCSIGSLIALWYIYGCPEQLYEYANQLFTYYKIHKNFYMYESIVKNIVEQLIKDDDMSKINDRLYINYYNTKKCENCVISQFKNRKHLLDCILRSSHIPFLTTKEHKYQGRYVDGIAPYIFEDGCTNLFIQLINFTNPLNCLNVKTEQNIYSRLLHGTIGINDFFVNGRTYLCTYVNKESYCILIKLYLRKQFVLFVLCLMEWIIIIKQHIPLSIRNTMLYNKFKILSKTYWRCIQNSLV